MGRNAKETTDNINHAFDGGTTSEHSIECRFHKINDVYESLVDEERGGRDFVIANEKFNALLVEDNIRTTVQELADKL